MTDVIVTNNVLGILVMIGIFGTIGVFLIKLYNLLYACEKMDLKEAIIWLAVGSICFFIFFSGSMLTIGQAETDATLLEYNLYIWMIRIFIVMIWIMFFAELIIYAGKKATSINAEETRMIKRRNTRIRNL